MGIFSKCSGKCQGIGFRSVLVLALVKKRRRLGYVSCQSQSCWRLRKILQLYALALRRRQCTATVDVTSERSARRWWRRPVFDDHDQCGAWKTLIPSLRECDEDMYYNFLRMTPSTFDRLLALVAPYMQKMSWRESISPGERLAITLRYLASGDSQTSMSFLFRVSNQAISKILLETTTVLWHVLKRHVFPKLTENHWLKTAAEFQVLWNIPHCMGAVDGKQVPVKAFPHCGSRWFGYKKRHCMTFMAVSDAKHRFLIVESGASGKRADANIFHKSSFAKKLGRGELNVPPSCPVADVDGNMPFFFVGDNAYPRSMHFATPFKGQNLRDEEVIYNYRISRARRVVENAFGILCARFRIFFRSIEGSSTLVRSIILACLALHNFHIQDEESVPPERRKYRPHGYADYIREDGKYIYGRWRHEQPESERALLKTLMSQVAGARATPEASLRGEELREMLVRHFVFNAVPWQWKKIMLD